MSPENAPPIGLVGLGTMGGRMARRLLDAGHELAAFDVNETASAAAAALGAKLCASPAEVASSAAVVLVSLPTPEIVESVACGPEGLAHGDAMRTYVDLSTTGPAVAERVAAALSEKGVACVDAPVSGGPKGAAAGTLSVMVAGDSQAIEDVRPILSLLGRNVFVVGSKAGEGQVVKLANNLLSASAVAVTAEVLTLGSKVGIDPAVMLEVFNASSGRNTATADKFPNHVLTRSFDFGFRMALMSKDVRLCLDEARRRGVPMLVGGALEQVWSLAAGGFETDADLTRLVELYESWAHTTVEGSEP